MRYDQYKHTKRRFSKNNFLLCDITTLVAKCNCVDTMYLGFCKTFHILQTCMHT